MRSKVTSNHFSDADGNPCGGTTYGQGFAIGWQNGQLGRGDDRIAPNGAFVQDIITAAIGRLEFYQAGKFCCDDNAEALACLVEARMILNRRTVAREDREVEGTHVI